MRPPSSSSESLNDILDTMSDTDKDDQILGDAEKVCHFYIDKSSAKRINQNIKFNPLKMTPTHPK